MSYYAPLFRVLSIAGNLRRHIRAVKQKVFFDRKRWLEWQWLESEKQTWLYAGRRKKKRRVRKRRWNGALGRSTKSRSCFRSIKHKLIDYNFMSCLNFTFPNLPEALQTFALQVSKMTPNLERWSIKAVHQNEESILKKWTSDHGLVIQGTLFTYLLQLFFFALPLLIIAWMRKNVSSF